MHQCILCHPGLMEPWGSPKRGSWHDLFVVVRELAASSCRRGLGEVRLEPFWPSVAAWRARRFVAVVSALRTRKRKGSLVTRRKPRNVNQMLLLTVRATSFFCLLSGGGPQESVLAPPRLWRIVNGVGASMHLCGAVGHSDAWASKCAYECVLGCVLVEG